MRSVVSWASVVVVCLVLGTAGEVFAQQPVSFGIKTGVPITSLLQTSGIVSWQGFSFPSPTQKPNSLVERPGAFDFVLGFKTKR